MISAPTAVYRLFDAADRLLYVGATDSPGTRWAAHASSKAWWPDVVRYTLSWHELRAQALAEEARAIRTEAPVYNVTGTDFDAYVASLTIDELRALPIHQPRPPSGPRRPQGTGGLYQRTSDGLWIATPPGSRKTFAGKTPERALAKRDAWMAQQGAA